MELTFIMFYFLSEKMKVLKLLQVVWYNHPYFIIKSTLFIISAKLGNIMNKVHQALNIPDAIKWGSQKSLTFHLLANDFMKPVNHFGMQNFIRNNEK